MKVCKYCNSVCDDNAKFCTSCGAGGADAFSHKCENCGKVYAEGNFCPYCGTRAGQRKKCCPRCGTEYYSNACPSCGYLPSSEPPVTRSAPQPQVQTYVYTQAAPKNQKDKWVAFLLCLFGGVIGLHKFYEGKIIAGIIYLCTGGLFGFGMIIDLIAILMKPRHYTV